VTFDPVTNELTFIPPVDNNGDVAVPFTVTDNNGGTITPTVTFQPVNPGPDAINQTVVTAPGAPVDIDPLANDSDPDGDLLTITDINGVILTPGSTQTIPVANGTVTVAANGTITVTPNAGFTGDIDVPYGIVDQDGITDTAVHSIVTGNAPPEVVDPDPTPGTPSIDPLDLDNIIVPAIDGESLVVDLDDYLTDPNGDSLAYTPVALPAGTTFNPATNEVTFIPTVDNEGDTVIEFIVSDGNGGSFTPTLTIQPVNIPPVAVDETVRTPFETPIEIDLLENDFDPDGDPLTVTVINGVTITPGIVQRDAVSTVAEDGAAAGDAGLLANDADSQTIEVPNGVVVVAADGTITVIPDDGFSGQIDIPYDIIDQDGQTDSAVHTVIVPNAPPEVADPDPTPGTPSIDPLDTDNILVPTIDGQSITIDLDDYLPDPNGDSLTIVPKSLPAGATFNPATNEITFIPTVDNTGDTVIPFIVTDSNGGTIATTITIQPVNPGPEAIDETITTGFETPVAIALLANDADPDGDPLTITEINGVALTPGTAQSIAVPNGSVVVAADGKIILVPNDGFSGVIDVPYTIADQDSAVSNAIHSVEVASAPFAAATPTASGNIDLLTVIPSVPRPAIVSNNTFERGFDRQEVDSELVILDAVEELGTLKGTDLAGLINLDTPPLSVTEAVAIEPVATVVYAGSEGFSSGKGYPGTISIDPTDECGRFFIDTIIRDSMLSVITRSTIDPEQSSGVVSFSATLANGEPLPDWVSPIGDGEYLIDPSVGVESVALKLTAHRESGWGLERYVEIDTGTGEITELKPDADASQADVVTELSGSN